MCDNEQDLTVDELRQLEELNGTLLLPGKCSCRSEVDGQT
jgi:hypothetical protein